jgi:hypothetical protein
MECEDCGISAREKQYAKYPYGEKDGIYWHIICRECLNKRDDIFYYVCIPYEEK